MPDQFSTTNCFFTYTKRSFFTKLRRFLLFKAAKNQYKSSDQSEKLRVLTSTSSKEEKVEEGNSTSSKEGKVEEGMEKEIDQDDWMVLQRSVKGLHFGRWEEKELAAKEIKKLAKEDMKRRKSMAELGVIQPLVAMVESEVVKRQRLAVQALIELANGSFT